jgi:hypothetical protein
MTFVTKKHLSRRTVLRGLGVSICLPLLDSMVPAQTPLAQTAANPKLRLALCFMPHGAVMTNWTPVKRGSNFKLSRTLTPLAPYQDQVVVISNLAHKMAAPAGPGDNGGDHTRSPTVYLSGVHPKRTDGADIRAGVTIDQIAAMQIGQQTPLPSLELATEDFSGLVGSCDVGFSCAYMNTISWRTPTTPLPMEINPRVVFDRLFGDGATAEERLERIEQQRSILDAVTGQMHRLERNLGANDRNRVAEYLDTVREIERRIQLAEKQNANSTMEVPQSPTGIPDDHETHTKLMFDLMTIAFQADITRISTFMMAREVSYRTFPKLGISEGFHPASHHQNNPERLENLTKINTYHVGLVAYFLGRLKATPDGDGNLLDHSLVLYGSGMSNSNVHNHSPLPVFVAGSAVGQIKGGRHLLYPDETPMANLLLSILHKAGIQQDSVGDSTGPLTEL